MLRRFVVLGGAVAMAFGTLVATSTPAFAATKTQCSSLSGHATLSPGISTTHQASHVSGTAAITGCVGGGVTSGTITFSGNTIAGDCTSLAHPTNGQVNITGTFSIHWNTGANSSGSLKSKSTTNPVQVKVITKFTSGLFAGTSANPVKGKVLVQFTPDAGQDCTTTPITGVSVTNVSGSKYTVASAH
jgi:hypothetical protein